MTRKLNCMVSINEISDTTLLAQIYSVFGLFVPLLGAKSS